MKGPFQKYIFKNSCHFFLKLPSHLKMTSKFWKIAYLELTQSESTNKKFLQVLVNFIERAIGVPD